MTNEEKREYLSLRLVYQSTSFKCELEKMKNCISKIPKQLYKYRKFDNYAFDMIENEYVYLSPADLLDDPFDCLIKNNLDEIYDKFTNNLATDMIDYIYNYLFSHTNLDELNKTEIVKKLNNIITDVNINTDILKLELDKNNTLKNEEKEYFLMY